MSCKFAGTYQALKDRILLVGLEGEWRQQPNRVWRFICSNGAGLNWSETRKTLWFDGPASAKTILEAKVRAVLVNGRPSDDVTVFVVHGCGASARQRMELTFRQLGLEPEIFEFVPF